MSLDLESYSEYYTQLSLNNPFRQLTGKEQEAVSVMDNRDLFQSNSLPNNSVFITCPHSTNDHKEYHHSPTDTAVLDSQTAYDIGAFELANDVSEKLK